MEGGQTEVYETMARQGLDKGKVEENCLKKGMLEDERLRWRDNYHEDEGSNPNE